MSHYQERLEQDLTSIRERLCAIGAKVEEAFRNSIQACLHSDQELASATILGDLAVNRAIRRTDAVCHSFVARHLPSAGHLRFVSSVLRLNVALERIGDYAVAVGRETAQLSGPVPDRVARDIDLISDQALMMLRQALRSFEEGQPELARGTKGMASQVAATYQRVFDDLLEHGAKDGGSVKDLVALLVIINRVGRVAGQAKNICEETIFTVTGETKAPKVYNVLFLDEKNDAYSQLAQAFATKVFPNSGKFCSAGWAPGTALKPQLELFLDENGHDSLELQPTSLTAMRERLSEFHVIVGLEAGVREKIEDLPFHTTFVHWNLGDGIEGLDAERAKFALDEAYGQLTVEIRELMETLRGGDAD